LQLKKITLAGFNVGIGVFIWEETRVPEEILRGCARELTLTTALPEHH